MREPKKVKLGRLGKSKTRKELKEEADRELWEKLNRIGKTSTSSQISSGSLAIDARLKRTIGMPKGDPTANVWFGQQDGPINYQEIDLPVTQGRYQVWKWIDEKKTVAHCLFYIWVDDGPHDHNAIAESFGGSFLKLLPPNVLLLEQRWRKITRKYNDTERASKD